MDKTVKVWDRASGALLRTLEGHTEHVNAVALDGDVIVSCSHDKTVKVWDRAWDVSLAVAQLGSTTTSFANAEASMLTRSYSSFNV